MECLTLYVILMATLLWLRSLTEQQAAAAAPCKNAPGRSAIHGSVLFWF